MPIDISNLTLDELKALNSAVNSRLSTMMSQRRKELLKELDEIEAILESPRLEVHKPTKKVNVIKDRYVSPDGETWSGIGRAAGWMTDYVQGGGNPQDLSTYPPPRRNKK